MSKFWKTVKTKKLILPNELTNDSHFCAYVLRHFINEYIINNKLTSDDDIRIKTRENQLILLYLSTKAISQGCYQSTCYNNIEIFTKACKELYIHIIKTNPLLDPSNSDCEYFKVQNKIALGEMKPAISYDSDCKLDNNLFDSVVKEYSNELNIQEQHNFHHTNEEEVDVDSFLEELGLQ